MSFSAEERRALADILRSSGPDAPTLCGGWKTRDLAAHLYVREHFHRGPRPYEKLVDAWAAGPSPWNPMRWLDGLINSAEHFVHHEDVRRGDAVARPRDFDAERTKQLIALLERMAPIFLCKEKSPVVLVPSGARPITVGSLGVSAHGSDVIRVSGQAGELLLWLYGREAVVITIERDGQPYSAEVKRIKV